MDQCKLKQWEYLQKSKDIKSKGCFSSEKESSQQVLDCKGYQFVGSKWLESNSLLAKKLTIIDVLSPTIIEQKPTYVGILNKKVYAKVFDDVMPFTYHSPEDKGTIRFVNPSAVDLINYESKLKELINLYDKKIIEILWPFIPQPSRDILSIEGTPISFIDNKNDYQKVIKSVHVPTLMSSIKVISKEILQAQTYLSQSEQLRMASSKSKKLSVPEKRSISDDDSTSTSSNQKPFRAKQWLKKNGLISKKLTIIDVLSPTVIKQKPKYVGVLKKKVYAKVFDDVMPFSYHSPEEKDTIRFVNPSAVDLATYEEKLKKAINLYDRKAARVIWHELSEDQKDEFPDGDEIPLYSDEKERYDDLLKSADIPISPKSIALLEAEMKLAETFLKQSEQLRDRSSATSEEEPKKVHPDKPPKLKGPLVGYRVIARNNVDGFYYRGTVIGPGLKPKEHLVEFDDFDQQCISGGNLIPIEGATARPRANKGDYVLVKLLLPQTTQFRPVMYAPGLVTRAPSDPRDRTFLVLLFTGEQLIASRQDLLRITKERYKSTADEIFLQLQRSRDSVRCRLLVEGNNEDMRSTASTLDEILKNNLLINRTSTAGNSEVGENSSFTGQMDLHGETKNSSNCVKDKSFVDASVETQNMIKVTLECGLQVGGENADSQTYISNEFWDELDKVKYKDFDRKIVCSEIMHNSQYLPVLPDVELPVFKVSNTLNEQAESETTRSNLEEIDGRTSPEELSTFVVHSPGGTLSSSSITSSSSSISTSSEREWETMNVAKSKYEGDQLPDNLESGDLVLARCSDTGAFIRGKLKTWKEGIWLVREHGGSIAEVEAQNIILDNVRNNDKKSLQNDDTVMALYPGEGEFYVPAKIRSIEDDLTCQVVFYDDTKERVARDELYPISKGMFHENITFIEKVHDDLLGSIVHARDDLDGLYRQGMVTSISGRTLTILMKGDTRQHSIKNVYFRRKDDASKNGANKDGFCLCPLDELCNTYGPGKIVDVLSGGKLRIILYDESELYSVLNKDVFVIEREVYASMIEYINRAANLRCL